MQIPPIESLSFQSMRCTLGQISYRFSEPNCNYSDRSYRIQGFANIDASVFYIPTVKDFQRCQGHIPTYVCADIRQNSLSNA